MEVSKGNKVSDFLSKISVEKQEIILKLTILTCAAILCKLKHRSLNERLLKYESLLPK